MKSKILTVLTSALIGGLVAFAVCKTNNNRSDSAYVPADSTGMAELVRTVNLSASEYPDFTYAAENSVDAVVYVQVSVKTQQQYQMIDPFSFFFGDPGQPQVRERVQKGSGSGVIIRSDGYIVTNNHVVNGATEISVMLNNKSTYTATVIGTDPATDVALIKIDATGLPCIPFADSDRLRLGEWVLAIGSPLGQELQSTITAGIVSAKGRSIPSSDGQYKIESFIQTDAAVNPGNSGGALVNKQGQLVGINTAIVSTTGAYSGYSFAIPANIVRKIVEDLIDFGSVKRARLGVTMSQVDEKTAREMKLSAPEGVYVHEVSKGSAAEKAGIKEGDVIVAIDSTAIKTPAGLQEKVNSFRPGDSATVVAIRKGERKTFGVTFEGTTLSTGSVDEYGALVFYGAKLKATDRGVEVVSAGSGKFAEAGGEDGFVIQYVNGTKVSKPQEVIDIAKKTKRAIFIEGVTATGKKSYIGFGSEED